MSFFCVIAYRVAEWLMVGREEEGEGEGGAAEGAHGGDSEVSA